jgi:Flp pilus assembly protein TadB
MSGETKEAESGLTTDTLKLLMDAEIRRIDDRESAFLETYRRDQEKANEFRAALDDLSKTMAGRRELEQAVASMTQRMDGLAVQGAELRSRLDVGPAALGPLQAYQQQQAGRQLGQQMSQATLFAVVGLVGTVVAIIAVLANVLTR